MDDRELAARLARDPDAGFATLVLAHQDRLYTIALRLLGDPSDAEEVAQDGLMRAYRALKDYDKSRIEALRLRPWLAAIVVNLARNRRRRRGDRHPPGDIAALSEGVLEPSTPPAEGPDAIGSRREEAELWAGRLLRCPPLLRVALVLRHVDGLSYDEIAQVLNRPSGTVKARVHRGLAWLRADLLADEAGFKPGESHTEIEQRRAGREQAASSSNRIHSTVGQADMRALRTRVQPKERSA